MVDQTRVRRLLQSLTASLAALDRESRAPASRRADKLWLPGVKYLFANAIEACMDVAQHFCSSEGWGPPNTNAHAMRVLGQHEVLPFDLAAEMADAVGFRNILVHQYVDVDNSVVVARLADHEALRRFARAVADYLPVG